MITAEVGRETRSPLRSGRTPPLARDAVLDDAELVAAAIRNEEWAWAALVERYSGLISSIAWSYHMRRDDTAEMRQVVWLRLFENIHRIRDTERIAGWIRTVARHECQRMFLKNSREVLGMDETAFDRRSDDAVGGGLLAHERTAALRRALVRLPDKGRVLLESQIAEPELTYAELATRLHMARGSVGPTRQRCVAQLRGAPELSALAGPL